MIIFLYGKDDFRRSRKRVSIIEQFLSKNSPWALTLFDPEEGASPVAAFLGQETLFGGKKLGVLGNLETWSEDLGPILKKAREGQTTFILEASEKPKKALSFLLEDPVLREEFPYLSARTWSAFIEEEARARGIFLTPDALAFFAEAFEGNTWGAITELEKLRSFKSHIARGDLAQFDLEANPETWGLLQRVKSPGFRERLSALHRLYGYNEAPAKIFNILSALWAEKNPQFADFDVKLKSGRLEYEEALLDLVLS